MQDDITRPPSKGGGATERPPAGNIQTKKEVGPERFSLKHEVPEMPFNCKWAPCGPWRLPVNKLKRIMIC